ncbi:hypothetical protein CJF32_00010827 [Rutstroemia sp. NJR-2017a WRK4]|nr:hypothetical protein CJF32_00010827 [Rutstroemia sp. NJR-2017a WRK4]
MPTLIGFRYFRNTRSRRRQIPYLNVSTRAEALRLKNKSLSHPTLHHYSGKDQLRNSIKNPSSTLQTRYRQSNRSCSSITSNKIHEDGIYREQRNFNSLYSRAIRYQVGPSNCRRGYREREQER